ncbi:malonyl-[acyl-carrier protein] O-methyltransferase [Holospora obtusa F1]|uniref:Malonyl-[acyl-carrier protein] O-methyltransferase n=1 Tax=Holospora obtusa F1 TaxID=1399147 RepID=W6TU20_HOLOB|nr:methyltransferase domain-containing protein [Holospora obtusa]ETZ07292.1 malonyl-[acyl-carrier protein] O-methyltransferase [Holospora obtusa F1]
MSIFIQDVQNNFNKASTSYDCVGEIQKRAAKFLVNKFVSLKNYKSKTILDLGTGTGYIPELLLPIYPSHAFYLNDIANEMLNVCKSKFSHYQNVKYLLGDMMKLGVVNYECILSNLALQWAENLNDALELFNKNCEDVFAFSTLVKGTFQNWENILNQYQSIRLCVYPTAHELTSVCHKLKKHNQVFNFWLMNHSLTFIDVLSFVRYLKMLGASASYDSIDLVNFRRIIKENFNPFTVTYKIFFGIFRNRYS